jgi:hypothetical protein
MPGKWFLEGRVMREGRLADGWWMMAERRMTDGEGSSDWIR